VKNHNHLNPEIDGIYRDSNSLTCECGEADLGKITPVSDGKSSLPAEK
jgi:hypothetical protein